jgi:hypothetical protein
MGLLAAESCVGGPAKTICEEKPRSQSETLIAHPLRSGAGS